MKYTEGVNTFVCRCHFCLNIICYTTVETGEVRKLFPKVTLIYEWFQNKLEFERYRGAERYLLDPIDS